MRYRASILISALFTAFSLLNIPAAYADAIDGNWCFTDGRHFFHRRP